MPRLKQLNYYVKCQLAPVENLPQNEEALDKWGFKNYDVVILTEANNSEITLINDYCRKHAKKLIVADSYGAFTRVITDFGDSFDVLDKNGEDLQDVMVKTI